MPLNKMSDQNSSPGDPAHQIAKLRDDVRKLRRYLTALGILCLLAIAGGITIWQHNQDIDKQQIIQEKQVTQVEEQKLAQEQSKRAEEQKAQEKEQDLIPEKERTEALEQSLIEEGYAWLERARNAEKENDALSAAIFAAKAVGFVNYGREEVNDPEAFAKEHPILLTEKRTPKEYAQACSLISNLITVPGKLVLPIWTSPDASHHVQKITDVAYSPDGKMLASASSDKTIKLWGIFGEDSASLLAKLAEAEYIQIEHDGVRVKSQIKNLYQNQLFPPLDINLNP